MIVLTTASAEDIFGVARRYGKLQWTCSFRANAIDRVDGLRFHKGPTSKLFRRRGQILNILPIV